MPSSFKNFAAMPVGMFLVMVFFSLLLVHTIRAVARWALLPTARRDFVAQQQQQQQQEVRERHERLRFYLDNVRRRSVATAEQAQRVQAHREWLVAMEEQSRRNQEALAKEASEYGAFLRRDVEIRLGRSEADDQHRKDAAKFSSWSDDERGLLYDSDDDDPEVIRGDKKMKKDK